MILLNQAIKKISSVSAKSTDEGWVFLAHISSWIYSLEEALCGLPATVRGRHLMDCPAPNNRVHDEIE
jgi:hypothetical protein